MAWKFFNPNPCNLLVGDYFDTWDSGQEVPIYYWKKEE